MENFVFLAVLFAALCHAGWNALIKVGLDPLSTTTLIAIGSAVVGLVCLPLAGMPAAAAWPWLIASVVIHLLYFAALIESYRTGDLGQVYPIARGSAPLMTAGASVVFVGEHLSLMSWSGIVVLAAGVLLLSARGGRALTQIDRRAVGFALLTALTICAYSVVDGIGARASFQPAVLCALAADRQCAAAGALCAVARRPRPAAGDAALLAARAGRRRLADPVLRHHAVGDDAGADRHRCNVARRPACCSARSSPWRC